MATSIDILVETNQSLEDLVKELEHLLQLSFTEHADDEGIEIRYEYADKQREIIVTEQTYLMNDRTLLFEDYRYIISVDARGYQNYEENWQQQRALSRHIFEQLKATDRYRLLMVDNGQIFMDTYTPRAFPQEPSALTLQARTLPASLDINLYVEAKQPFDLFFKELTTYLGVSPQHLPLRKGWQGYDYDLPTMRVTLSHKSNKNVLQEGLSCTIHAEARVRLPGGLRIPGERRYWVFEFLMSLFEHFKAAGCYRLYLRNDDEDRNLAVFEPKILRYG